ncbi:hypothetical protein NECID01_0405 [Nematocida sp. AWRm77]|nr:hypothetical protein NECID01_0405 [Nematocida sp. AWRm77]
MDTDPFLSPPNARSIDTRAPSGNTSLKEINRKTFETMGLCTTTGIKYGADFLVYLGCPKEVHSSFTVNTDPSVSFKHLSALVRVSSSTKKETVLCTQDTSVPFVVFTRFFL